MFLITAIERQKVCFTYVRKWRPKRMNKSKIMLPINHDGTPDYKFMEEYIIQIKNTQQNRYIEYCKKQLAILGESINISPLYEKQWNEFSIIDLFNTPKRGKRIVANQYIEGNLPVVSSAGDNNGIIAFAGNTRKVRIYEDCLSVANGGVSAGFAFYHPYRFIATDHVTHFKGCELNKYLYLFLSSVIKKQLHTKYHFCREISDNRLEREIILAPVNEQGTPDFQYMEQYAKNLLIKKYKSYLNYIARK